MVQSKEEKYRRKNIWRAEFRKTIRGKMFSIFENAQNRAKRKGLSFNLTKAWLEEQLVDGRCQVTGIKFETLKRKGHFSNVYAPSVDRINPKKGYIKSNCQVILWGVNAAKREMSMKEFKSFLIEIMEGMNND